MDSASRDNERFYQLLCKWFACMPFLGSALTLFIDAPFGRFSPKRRSIFLVDGIKSWIIMELVAPITFLIFLYRSPLSSLSVNSSVRISHTAPQISLLDISDPRMLLALLFLTHYLNRALLSPLRTPQRARAHVIVPLSAVCFNVINGTLLGTYLASPAAFAFLSSRPDGPRTHASAYSRPIFWLGIMLWAFGFIGNVLHDEVLLQIRREATAAKKMDESKKGKNMANGEDEEKLHYGIPRGYLYTYISYPNYFCEWIEWLGFALAAAPFPSLPSFSFLPSISFPRIFVHLFFSSMTDETFASILNLPGIRKLPSIAPTITAAVGTTTSTLIPFTPPYLFLFAEILLMTPRALRGHIWYRKRFGADYPRERRAVIPFIL